MPLFLAFKSLRSFMIFQICLIANSVNVTIDKTLTKGISVAEVREQMALTIEEAYNTDDPKAQKEFKKLFGNKKPTPEEFIYKMSKKLIKEK